MIAAVVSGVAGGPGARSWAVGYLSFRLAHAVHVAPHAGSSDSAERHATSSY